jgi:hypothetical protein
MRLYELQKNKKDHHACVICDNPINEGMNICKICNDQLCNDRLEKIKLQNLPNPFC